MSCTYTYKGKQYSKVGLLRVLSQSQSAISENAREFLRSKLGMLDHEIEIVKGLIDNKSLGRFLEDGKLLFSNLADDSVAYHEAFHRVFRMYLTPEERKAVINENRKRVNIEKYRKIYPDYTEDELVEEFIADEFSDYMLNNRKMETPMKTWFDRIIDFIKKLLGISKNKLATLYREIEEGKYSGKPLDVKYRYSKQADKIKIGDREYSSEIKNDFIQAVAKEFMSEVFKQGSVYDLINGKIDKAVQTDLYEQSFMLISEALVDEYPEMVSDFLDDFAKGPMESYLSEQFKQYLKTIVGKFEYTIIEESENKNTDEGVGEEEAGRPNDDSAPAWTASIEIDPKTSMSKAIKMLLASFVDTDKQNSLGLDEAVRWSSAFNKIAQHLAGVPTQDSIKHLSKMKESWAADLVEYLGGVNPENLDTVTFRLRNDFIKTFSKTQHTYVVIEVEEDGIKSFDANQNTKEKKKLREWNDNMILAIKKATDSGSFDLWLKRLKVEIVDAKFTDINLYPELLGIDVDDELKNVQLYTQNGQSFYYSNAMKNIAEMILDAAKLNNFSDSNTPDWPNLFNKSNFDIEGTMKKLAAVQNEYEDAVDLMVYSRDKKLYGISLNTYTTTTINTLNYVADMMNPDSSLSEKLNIIEQYIPHVLNYQTVDKLSDGSYRIKSKWLNHILNGNKIKMVIVDGIKNNQGDNEALSDINESDLHAATLNLSLRGINISFKHSDRSVFYGYQMENGSIFDYQDGPYRNANEVMSYLKATLTSQLKDEVKRANLKDIPLIQYFKDKYKDSQLFNLKNIQDLNPESAEIQSLISKAVDDAYYDYKKQLADWGVIDARMKEQIGLSQDLVIYHNDNLDLALASSFANQMLTHLEEMKLLLGDFSFFKTAEDFYKRMSTTSGTGENLVNDPITNAKIQEANNIEFQLYEPRSSKLLNLKYDKVIDGKFTSVTFNEKDDYTLEDATELTIASPLDGQMISKVQYGFEWNMMNDLKDQLTDDLKKSIRKLAENYTVNYRNMNENDGQSWMNMFFFREYMMRLGNWSQAMENVFRVELKVLSARSLKDLKDIKITIDGVEYNAFDNSLWDNGWLDSVNTLKSQYAGPTQAYNEYKAQVQKDISERIFPYTIYKTSYHVLWPSAIIGTNLSQMQAFMLKNKIDVIHMNSANKSGSIEAKSVFKKYNDQLNDDQKKVSENGLDFYDSYGHFNDFVFEEDFGKQLLDEITSVADVTYLKDQVKIGNHEKTEIKGSTQSLKIMLSNLFNNGEERFEGASKILSDYKKVVAQLVNHSVNDLLKEIGDESQDALKKLVKVIKQAADDRSSPVNIIEAIEGFLSDPYIETLPNKSKLENIFYSIITNNVISFNRPGNAYPQVAATGWENVGEREIKNDTINESKVVNFYSFDINENGDIVKVNPAEIIIPLPKAWIPSVLKAAKTNNLVEAIQWINDRLEKGSTEIIVKGLRIPNQQLSSNDIFKIKKFNLPTNVNYVVVPSGIVTKVGADS